VFSSVLLTVLFTAAFTVTGLYSLVRFAALTAGVTDHGDRVAELSHLLMSLAMIAMTWAWSGGPDSASGILQIVVFGLFGLYFLARAIRPNGGHHGRSESAHHLVMAAVMVWMVAAMAVLRGSSGMSGDAHASHGSMTGMDGMSGMAGMTGMGGTRGVDGMSMSGSATPYWATVVSIVLVALLATAAGLWMTRAVLPSRITEPAPESAPTDALPEARAVARPRGAVVVAAPSGVARIIGPRLDAGCHLLMSLGMAGLLLAML
jgi:hypothetical protein